MNKLLLLGGLVFVSHAYAANDDWEVDCREDQLTGDFSGSVRYIEPLNLDFTLSINLYGYSYGRGITMFTSSEGSKLKPEYSNTVWYHLPEVVFLPSKARGIIYFGGSESRGSFFLGYLPTVSKKDTWFANRLFAEDKLRVRFSYYDDSATIYDIPLEGLEEKLANLIKECEGKAKITPHVKRYLPKNIKKQLK